MMKRALLAAPLMLLPAASALPIQPGKWQSTVTITDMQFPNAPPGMAAAMRGRPTTVTTCVTAQQAADGPRSLMANSHGKCHFTSYSASAGRFDAVMQCTFASSMMTQTSHGTFTATTMDVSNATVMTGRAGMSSKSHTMGRRIGGC